MTARQSVLPVFVTMVALTVWPSHHTMAGVRSGVLRELTEALVRRPPPGWTRELAEAVSDDLIRLGARYGDELVVQACQKVSPRVVVTLLREAGQDGEEAALKLLARHGDDAAWIIRRPQALAIFKKHGDEAAEALVKHRSVAEPLIETYGTPMARALSRVDGQNARRLAMLHQDGTLQKMPHREQVLGR